MGAASVCTPGRGEPTASGVAGSVAGAHLGRPLRQPARQFSAAEKEMGARDQFVVVERPLGDAVDTT